VALTAGGTLVEIGLELSLTVGEGLGAVDGDGLGDGEGLGEGLGLTTGSDLTKGGGGWITPALDETLGRSVGFSLVNPK